MMRRLLLCLMLMTVVALSMQGVVVSASIVERQPAWSDGGASAATRSTEDTGRIDERGPDFPAPASEHCHQTCWSVEVFVLGEPGDRSVAIRPRTSPSLASLSMPVAVPPPRPSPVSATSGQTVPSA